MRNPCPSNSPLLTRADLRGAASISRDGTRRNSRLITPTPLVKPTDPVTLPRPEDPAAGALKRLGLGCPPAAVPLDLLLAGVADGELVVVLDVIGHGQGPLAYDDAVLALVVACCADVSALAAVDARVPAVVPVVVEGGAFGGGKGGCWVAGAPGGTLHTLAYFLTPRRRFPEDRGENTMYWMCRRSASDTFSLASAARMRSYACG